MENSLKMVADIGATHARFASYSGTDRKSIVLATTDYQTASHLVADAAAALKILEPESCCIAVAGPVANGNAEITNGGLSFSAALLGKELGCAVHLVNDFHALARAVPALVQLEQIGGNPALSGTPGVKAVLGPGSGLGMGLLIPRGKGSWQVLPSEGGHADLAPGNPLEQEVLKLLQHDHGNVCWETVLSGPGLVNLYQAVATLWGAEPKPLSPEQVSGQGIDAADPICHQTLELFFSWLGAAAANLALMVCARSGVYIGGGIVPQLVDFAVASSMRRRFDERAGLESFVEEIPLFLILDPDPGLIGARICLDDP